MSASFNSISTSPTSLPKELIILFCLSSCIIGAPSFIASSWSITNGNTSYSTSISFIAFRAIISSMATTAATGSPQKRTLSVMINLSSTSLCASSKVQGCPAVANFIFGKSW